MNKVVASLLLSLGVGGVAMAGFTLTRGSGTACRSCERTAAELVDVKEELRSLREETRALLQEVRTPGSDPAPAMAMDANASLVAAAQAATAKDTSVGRSADIKASVLVALDEDRKQRDAERQLEREAARQRAEEKRQETAAMKEGPYDRFNLKVNSLGKVLGLTDAQKQSYFELAKQSRDKLDEARKGFLEAGGGRRGPPGGDRASAKEAWDKAREVEKTIQKEFDQSVQAILTASQIETYNQLGRSAREVQSLEQVAAPGDEGARFVRPGNRFPNDAPRRGPGGPGFGAR
jgi:hypothetical protein